MKRMICALLAVILLSGCAATPTTTTCDEPLATEESTRAPTDPPTEPPTDPPTKEEIADMMYEAILDSDVKGKGKLHVDVLIQYPELPTGCESVALTIALRYFGYDLKKTDIAKSYLIKGDDYVTSFVGDPFSYGGAGIYPPGLVKTAEKFIKAKDSPLEDEQLIIVILSNGVDRNQHSMMKKYGYRLLYVCCFAAALTPCKPIPKQQERF